MALKRKPDVLIIGIGNPDRGDDAAGILVAQRLGEMGFDTISHTGSPLDLIQLWKDADHAILVDAVVSGATPGAVHVCDAHAQELQNADFGSCTHSFDLAGAIQLAQVLNQLPKKLTVYGIEGTRFTVGTLPSFAVRNSVERAAQDIASRLRTPPAMIAFLSTRASRPRLPVRSD